VSHSKLMTWAVKDRLVETLNIPNVTDVKLDFPLEGLVTAHVTFFMTVEQVEKLLNIQIKESPPIKVPNILKR